MADSETQTATIARTMEGISMDFVAPYEKGHQLTEAEARTLNQTRAENVGNNARARWKKWCDDDSKEGGAKASDAQKRAKLIDEVSKLDGEYDLNTAATARRLTDEEKMARSIAEQMVNKALSNQGLTRGKYGDKKYKAKVEEVSGRADVVAEATKRVEAMRAASSEASEDGVEL